MLTTGPGSHRVSATTKATDSNSSFFMIKTPQEWQSGSLILLNINLLVVLGFRFKCLPCVIKHVLPKEELFEGRPALEPSNRGQMPVEFLRKMEHI